MEKINLLVVCGRNKIRSRTAEKLFRNDSRLLIRSRGLSQSSIKQIHERDVLWADLILVMDNSQKSKLHKMIPITNMRNVEVLDIEDIYEYMDPDLVSILKDRINLILKNNYNI